MFEKIKRFYSMGLYTKKQVAQLVKRNVLTADDYYEIVGEQYVS